MASGLLLLHPHSTTTPHFYTVAYHEKKQPVDCDSVRETTPACLDESGFALVFAPVALDEFTHRQALLELDTIDRHGSPQTVFARGQHTVYPYSYPVRTEIKT